MGCFLVISAFFASPDKCEASSLAMRVIGSGKNEFVTENVTAPAKTIAKAPLDLLFIFPPHILVFLRKYTVETTSGMGVFYT
jgi:hypothetical protein